MSKYILNTSFHMTSSLADEFEQWVRDVYIPEAAKSEHLSAPRFTRIMTEVEPGTVSYAVQFSTCSLDDARRWHDDEAAAVKDGFFNRHNGQIVFFTTFMEEL